MKGELKVGIVGIICASVFLSVAFYSAAIVGIERAKSNQVTNKIQAQVNEIERSLKDLEGRVQSNQNANMAFDEELKSQGYDGYYIYKLEEEDSYGIDDMPTIP